MFPSSNQPQAVLKKPKYSHHCSFILNACSVSYFGFLRTKQATQRAIMDNENLSISKNDFQGFQFEF